jgi:hypothetical protein
MGKEDKDQRSDQGYQTPSSLYQAPVMAQDNTRTVYSANAQLQAQLHGQAPKPKPTPQLSNTQKVALIVGELALIMARLHCDLNPLNPLNLFDLHKGDFWGEIDVGELLLVMKLVAPPDKFAEATKNIVLDGKTYGTNRVFVRGNIFEAWINVASPELHVGGIKTEAFTSGAANLKGFSAAFDYPKGQASLSILEATLGTAQLLKGTDKISVDSLTIKGLHLDGGKTGSVLHGNMSFVSADMVRLRYPGMPPISLALAGGTSFAGVWQQQPKQELPAGQSAPTTAAAAPAAPPTSSKPLGADQMLPADAEIKVSITRAHAAAASFSWLTPVAGAAAGIEHAKIALVRASGLELASLAIHDFTVAGGMLGSGASSSGGAVGAIGKLELRGDAAMVQTLLSAPVVHPELASAVAAVRRLGIQPAIGGSVTLEDLHFGGLKQGQGAAARITGDFSSHIEVPKLGSLDVALRDFDVAGGTAGGLSSVNTSFASFTAVLRGDGGGELARLELEGGGVKVGKQNAGTLKTLKATGDVSGLLKALKEPMKTAPASVRGALAAVRALGVGVGVSASGLSVTETSKGSISYAGDLHASLKTNLGRIAIDAIGVRGTDASLGAMSTFAVTLYTAGGAKAASISATGLKANVASKKQNAGLHADHLEVHGDYAQVSAMIAAVRAKAPGLAPPVRQALGAVEDLHLQGQLALSVDDVSATESKQGRVSARIGALDNAFDVPGVGKVGLKLRGIEGAMGGGVGGSGGVDHFELRLLTAASGQALRIAFDGGNSEATAKAEDYAINLRHLELTGDATRLATMVAGARAHYQQMGGPALHTLEVVEQYLRAFPAQLGITIDNARMASIDGKQTGVGDITTSVVLPTGKVSMKLGGASIDAGGGEGGTYRFREFHLFIADAQGKVAASVQLLRGRVQDVADSPGVTGGAEELQVTGDMDRIRTLFSPEMRPFLPADMLAAFDQLAGSKLDLAIQDATVRSGFGDGTQIGVGALRLVSELRFRDEQGNQYEVRGGAHRDRWRADQARPRRSGQRDRGGRAFDPGPAGRQRRAPRLGRGRAQDRAGDRASQGRHAGIGGGQQPEPERVGPVPRSGARRRGPVDDVVDHVVDHDDQRHDHGRGLHHAHHHRDQAAAAAAGEGRSAVAGADRRGRGLADPGHRHPHPHAGHRRSLGQGHRPHRRAGRRRDPHQPGRQGAPARSQADQRPDHPAVPRRARRQARGRPPGHARHRGGDQVRPRRPGRQGRRRPGQPVQRRVGDPDGRQAPAARPQRADRPGDEHDEDRGHPGGRAPGAGADHGADATADHRRRGAASADLARAGPRRLGDRAQQDRVDPERSQARQAGGRGHPHRAAQRRHRRPVHPGRPADEDQRHGRESASMAPASTRRATCRCRVRSAAPAPPSWRCTRARSTSTRPGRRRMSPASTGSCPPPAAAICRS